MASRPLLYQPDGVLVFHAANAWDGVPFADQHLAARLSELMPVLYVDPAVSPLTPLKRPELRQALHGPRLCAIKPGLSRLVTVSVPGPERPGVAAVTTRRLKRSIEWALGKMDVGARALLSGPTLTPLVNFWPALPKVYWAQDDLVGGAPLARQSAGRIERAERRLSREARELVVSSPVVERTWQARGFRPVLIPFGWDDRVFTPAAVDCGTVPGDIHLEGPIVGFIGHLGERIDVSLLEGVAEAGHSLLLVGPRHRLAAAERFEALLARANVRWVGPKPFEELPAYMGAIDVGLVPYDDSAFNRSSFPLKTLEYLGSGRPVVATDLPAVRWLATDLVRIAGDRDRFVAEVGAALNEAADPEARAQRRAFAADHTWDRRAARFAEVVRGFHIPTCSTPLYQTPAAEAL